jgi:hypothetical protein
MLRAAPFPSAVINASFGDASTITKAFNWASKDRADPVVLEVMGDVIVGGAG